MQKLVEYLDMFMYVVNELVLYVVVFYLCDFVGEFYLFYNVECVLVDDVVLCNVCVVLFVVIWQVFENGLVVFGVFVFVKM